MITGTTPTILVMADKVAMEQGAKAFVSFIDRNTKFFTVDNPPTKEKTLDEMLELAKKHECTGCDCYFCKINSGEIEKPEPTTEIVIEEVTETVTNPETGLEEEVTTEIEKEVEVPLETYLVFETPVSQSQTNILEPGLLSVEVQYVFDNGQSGKAIGGKYYLYYSAPTQRADAVGGIEGDLVTPGVIDSFIETPAPEPVYVTLEQMTEQLNPLIKTISFDNISRILTITKYDGTVELLDLT